MECLWSSLEKTPWVGYSVLSGKKEYRKEWQSYTVLDRHPELKQIDASLRALGNNDAGLIQGNRTNNNCLAER